MRTKTASCQRIRSGSVLLLLATVAAPVLGAGAQSAVLSGRITSETGMPLEFATASIGELNVAVRSDENGRFSLVVPPGAVSGQVVLLRARAIGYLQQTREVILAPGVQTRDFVMRRDVNRLEEVVVTGAITGTAQNKMAFSVTRLSDTDMPVPASNPLQQLQGRVPGAQVVQPGGRPGTGPAVVLRGPKSLDATGRSQGPLIIVDGVLMNGDTRPGISDLQELNALDIESIEVVKGAAAASLYGSRAGAGVIQVTTRSGRSAGAGVRLQVRSEYGRNDVQNEYRYATRHFLMMDERNERFCIRVAGRPACSRTVDFDEEARRINDIPRSGALQPHAFERDYSLALAPSRPELKGLFQVNQWPTHYNPVAQVLRSATYVNNSADASVVTGGTSLFASISRLADEGAIRYLQGYRRTSLRANAGHVASERWQAQLTTAFTTSTQYPASSGPGDLLENDNFLRATRVPAAVNLLRRDSHGRLYIRPNPLGFGASNTNPLYDHENSDGQIDIDRTIASLTAKYSVLPWLAFDAMAGLDRNQNAQLHFRDRGYRTTNPSFPDGTPGEMYDQSIVSRSHNVMFGGVARFTASRLNGVLTSRYSYEQQDFRRAAVLATGFAVPGLRSLSNATTTQFLASEEWSIRAIGAFAGAQLEYRERYIADALVRFDGSSLFGADERWHPYYRGSLAWRLSEEPFWRWSRAVSDLKLRASVGTAGGRPTFNAQYETYFVAPGGQVTARTLGNPRLKPERTREAELGFDAELLGRSVLSFTYARAITTDQLLVVPAPVASGYPSQWANAGTLDGRTYELSLRVPVLNRHSFGWSSQLGWDRHRTRITELNVPPHFVNAGSWGLQFRYAPGELFGTIYGRRFVTDCTELPTPFRDDCGPGREWQSNDDGYIVWVGTGRSWQDGVRDNLWQAVRPGCLAGGGVVDATGELECVSRGGVVNAPWGAPEIHWGMPIVMRDSAGMPALLPLGNAMPGYRLSMSHSLRWKRASGYVLLDGSFGNRIFNLERNWSLGDFMVREQDQDGKSPETAKPLGYYWRASRPVNAAGVGGLYDVGTLGSNHTVENGSYLKLREVNLTLALGSLWFPPAEWTVSLIGRNLRTWTRYTGWDPEVGRAGGTVNSAAITGGGMFQYPPIRSLTLALGARF